MFDPEKSAPLLHIRPFRVKRNLLLWEGIWLLFLLAVSIRFYHLVSHEWGTYLHDIESHEVYAKYIADHHWLPKPDDEFETPQQPLYYVIAAGFINGHLNFDQTLDNLARLGFCISVATLIVTIGALRHISSWLTRYTLFVFMAFTPSFILYSCCVGNDGLVSFFGALFLLSILRLNRNPASTFNLILVMVALFGALLSKLSALVLLAALPWIFWRSAHFDLTWKTTAKRIAIITSLVAAWAGAVLYRAWNPETKAFVFSHGWVWDYMAIKENFAIYVTRFDLSSLIITGQANTVGCTPDYVRFSFPTWEYGNMLLGECEFASDPVLLFCTRQLIIAGTILLFGLILFFFMALFSQPVWPWRKIFSVNRLMLLMVVGTTFLLLNFVYALPNTCSADFRYQGVAWASYGFGIGRGLCAFPRSLVWKTAMWCFLAFYAYACVYFMIYLYIRR
jgi:hypothetical protein